MTGAKIIPFTKADPGTWGVLISGLTEEEIEDYVADLDSGQLAAFLLGAERVKKQATQAARMAESRITAEAILSSGEVWTAPDGTEYMWGGDRSRVCKDPAGLKAALASLGELRTLAKRAFEAAFRPQPDKVMLTELDRLSKFSPEAEEVIRTFLEWKESPPHLRPVQEDGR